MNSNSVKNVSIRNYDFINNQKLQHMYHVEIEVTDLGDDWYYSPGTVNKVTESKQAYFCSSIHVNKRVAVGPSFSGEFSDFEILRDHCFLTPLYQMYGTDIFTRF